MIKMARATRSPSLLKSFASLRSGRPSLQSGAETVEVALTIGYFIILLLAGIEMSMLLNAYVTNSYLARDALRYAVVRGSEADKDQLRAADAPATESSIESYINAKKLIEGFVDVTATWPNGQDPGDVVQITLSYDYQPMVIPGSAWFGPRTLTASTAGTILY